MRKLALVGTLLVGLAGCGGKKADTFDEVLGKLESFQKRLCACQDTACADDVWDEWSAYRKEVKSQVGGARPNASQDKRGRELTEAMSACRTKLREAAAPSAESAGAADEPGETPNEAGTAAADQGANESSNESSSEGATDSAAPSPNEAAGDAAR
jgi:hypothetical protein